MRAVGSVGAVLLLDSLALAQQSCLDQIRWEGGRALRSRVIGALVAGPLQRTAPTSCRDVRVRLAATGPGELHLDVYREDGHATHVVATVADAAMWLESWLVPVAAAPPAEVAADVHIASLVQTSHPRPHRATRYVEAPPPVAPSPEPDPIPLRADLLFTGDFDKVAPAWFGGELGFAVALREHVWLGVAAGAHVTPERRGEERWALRISARSGWRGSWRGGEVRLGLGAGVSSAHAIAERSESMTYRDEEAGPFVEGMWDWTRPFADHYAFVLGALLRLNLPDELKTQPEDQPLDPQPLPTMSLSIRLGLTWRSS